MTLITAGSAGTAVGSGALVGSTATGAFVGSATGALVGSAATTALVGAGVAVGAAAGVHALTMTAASNNRLTRVRRFRCCIFFFSLKKVKFDVGRGEAFANDGRSICARAAIGIPINHDSHANASPLHRQLYQWAFKRFLRQCKENLTEQTKSPLDGSGQKWVIRPGIRFILHSVLCIGAMLKESLSDSQATLGTRR
jgi:hypothetical protein